MSKEAKVGLLSIIGIVIFYYGFNFLKGKNLLSSQNEYVVVYDNIAGLTSGNVVMLNGYQIGLVDQTTMLQDGSGRIVVNLSLDSNVPIPRGSEANIVSLDLLGDKAVQIDLAEGGTGNLIADGDTLRGSVVQPITESLGASIEPLTGKIDQLLTSLDSVATGVNTIIQTGNIQSSLSHLDEMLAGLKVTAAELSSFISSQKSGLTSTLQNASQLSSNLLKTSEKLDGITTNAESFSSQLAATDVAGLTKQFSETAQGLNKAVEGLGQLMDGIKKGEGSLGALLNDQDLYTNLENASLSLNNLLEDLQNNPKKYVHFSVFGRKK